MKYPIPEQALGAADPTITPTEIDKAYAAGFFDGEGNICIAQNNAGGKANRYLIYNMRIGSSQKDATPLFWLRDRWGGSVQLCKRGERHYFIWGCFTRMAAAFLRDVLPHLIVKRERAELALRFQAMHIQPGRRGYSPDHKARQAQMKTEMNRLNAPSEAAA